MTEGIGQRLDEALIAALDSRKLGIMGNGLLLPGSRGGAGPVEAHQPIEKRTENGGRLPESWTQADAQKVLTLCRDGMTVGRISDRLGKDPDEVARYLIERLLSPSGDLSSRLGADRQGQPYTDEEMALITLMHSQGRSLLDIAREVHRTQLSVGKKLLNKGYPRQR